MIRDYIKGNHENYLAPLTALIIFYAFFALVSSVMQPVQHNNKVQFDKYDLEYGPEDSLTVNGQTVIDAHRVVDIAKIVKTGYTYLHLDEYPEAVHTQWESSLAALEATLRSQGIPRRLHRHLVRPSVWCRSSANQSHRTADCFFQVDKAYSFFNSTAGFVLTALRNWQIGWAGK